MRFRLFAIPVEIQVSFWITAVIFGSLGNANDDPSHAGPSMLTQVVGWTLVLFFSILIHELGHALAYKAFKVPSTIALHGMGGTTYGRVLLPLARWKQVIVSVAGPFFGFGFGALVYFGHRFVPAGYLATRPGLAFVYAQLLWVNFGWGLVNLVPVLPYDGGHVLEATLGPKRERITLVISTLIGGAITAFCLYEARIHEEAAMGFVWIAYIFGRGALMSFVRYRALGSVPTPAVRTQRAPETSVVPPELAALLQSARASLAEDRIDRALALAQQVMEQQPPPAAAKEAFEIIGWAHLMSDRLDAAMEALVLGKRLGAIDAALEGSLLFKRGELSAARMVLESARAKGDVRKQVAGPLVQVLLAEGEVRQASAIAVELGDTLNDDDARHMAGIAFDAGVFDSAARLWMIAFHATRKPEDAYEAARCLAKDGQLERALDWMRKAVEAGFHDAARAWSDNALEKLRGQPGFEGVLPRS